MINVPLTRRRFLEGCAVSGAAALSVGALAVPAFAEGGDIGESARPAANTVNTVCRACPHGCALTAYVVDGKLDKVIGIGSDPQAQGMLCARGYGFTQSAYDAANVKNPMRRKDDGSFQTITWDAALSEIGDAVTRIVQDAGAGTVACIYGGNDPTVAAYAPRFMHALGSGNAFRDDVTVNVNKEAAFKQVIGMDSYAPDFDRAALILLIDTSYADIATPSLAARLQAARERGVPIMAVDARMGTVASFANEWMAVNPGSELALILAVCNYLISSGAYDAEYVAAQTSGFDEWSAAIASCTPAWAEGITGVESARIEGLAARLIAAAPHVAIEYGNGRIGAASYVNSSETARAVCMLNTLLGAWGSAGGALLPYDMSTASFSTVMGSGVRAGAQLEDAASILSFPLGAGLGASAANALKLVGTGAVKALFAVDADIVYDYASMTDLSSDLERMELFVCVSDQMTETALCADYVLPVCSYLEADALPAFHDGDVACVSVGNAAIANESSNARSVSEIISGLSDACGVADAFTFTLDEATEAQLQAVGLTLAGMRVNGAAEIADGQVQRFSSWPTPTGKIQCASVACAEAGLAATPVWTPTYLTSNIMGVDSEDLNLGTQDVDAILTEGLNSRPSFHLICGQQTVLGDEGYNTEELTDIARMYGLDGIWINAQVANVLGIQDGDQISVGNDRATYQGRAFVTERIVPTALYMPSGFGHASEKQKAAKGFGFNPYRFCEPLIENGYGTLCTQEALIWLWKEGE